ncbi:PSP domain-containing protein [Ditylenchus destructor]|nr:PSP domain-containing protein [Ditylenchus destructor]
MRRKGKKPAPVQVDLCDESEPTNGDVNGGSRSSSPLECTFQQNDMFMIDTEACEEHENEAFVEVNTEQDLDISNVCSHFTPEPEKKKVKRGPQCFNCAGDHQMNECPEPRDNRRISQNRNNFRRSFQAGPRLHEQLEGGTSFKPGVVSDSLREALGLGPRDIPEWIYRFIEGYPPAYLKRFVIFNKNSMIYTDSSSQRFRDAQISQVKTWSILAKVKSIGIMDSNPEHFKVPPWDMFIAAHQKVLDDRSYFLQPPPAPPTQNENGTSSRKKQKYKHKGSPPPEKKKKRRKMEASLEEGELDEGEVEQVQNVSDDEVDDSVDDLVEVDCVEGDDVEASNDDDEVTILESTSHENGANSSTSENGSATPKTTMGAPILMNRLICADKMNHEVLKPSLDNFSHFAVSTHERGTGNWFLQEAARVRQRSQNE